MINGILLMIQTLTRIPLKKTLSYEKSDFRMGANFLFVIGLIVGGLQFLTYYLTKNILSFELIALIMVLEEIILTGAMHIDGFADTCDGFFAFKGKDKIIEIMKDSRIGAFAGIGIAANILFKLFCYAELMELYPSGLFIFLIPVLARTSMVFISIIGKPAKKEGTGNTFIGNLKILQLLINLTITFVIGYFVLGLWTSVIIILIAAIFTLLFNLMCRSKINGITGDSLGANSEIVAIMSLLGLIILKRLI